MKDRGSTCKFQKKRFALYEIYTLTLCYSYLHEKQTSRIQSLSILYAHFTSTTSWVSQRALVAKFYGRLQLIRSVLRAIILKFSVLKFFCNCNFVGLLHHPFWLQFVSGLKWYLFFTFQSTLFTLGSLMRVQYPKCAYGPNPI